MTNQMNFSQDPNMPHHHCHEAKRISWSAILAGALVGVGLGFLLNLFGVAIGLSAFSMTDGGPATLAVGGLLGIIISTIVAMYCAGFTSGYLGRLYVPRRNIGIIYGFTTWSVALILSAVLTTYVGTYVNTYSTSVTQQTVVVTTSPSTAKAVSSKKHSDEDVTTVTAKEATGGMAIGAFVVFVLFFIGALASCFGAHCGMTCRREEC